MNKPHVLVDARFSKHRRGGDRCRLELARGLMSRDSCCYTFLVYASGQALLQAIDPAVKTFVSNHTPDHHPHADFFEHITVPKFCRDNKIDLYHGTFQVMPWRRAARKTIATIHDLALFSFPEAYSRKFGPYMRALLRRAIGSSDHVISVSDATRMEVTARFPAAMHKTTTILNGVGSEFSPEISVDEVEKVIRKLDLPKRYVLFVGNLEKKKNLPRLIRAFLSLRSSGEILEDLVVVGSKPDKLPADELAGLFDNNRADWSASAKSLGVHFTGYVNEEDLPAIYRGALALAYPSIYEGFGMPILEAMASGIPVLTSDKSSLPEVANGAANCVDAFDIDAIAAGIKHVLQNSGWRRRAIASGLARAQELSWEQHVSKVEALYLSSLES